MLKKLLTNKKLLAVIVAVIVIIVGIVIAVVISQDSEEPGKSGINIETDKEEAQENDDEQDEPYNGTGLEIMDEVDDTVDSVDGSGDWDKQGNKTDHTQSDATNKEDSNAKGDGDDEEELDENILIDDKVWGEPS